MDRKAKLIYTDYDYLSEDEAAYQGYDTDGDSDYSVGFTVNEYERKREAREALETNNNEEGCQDSEVEESPEDDDTWLDGDEDILENVEPDDEQVSGDPEEDADEADWYEESESDVKISPESYVIDGQEYKDPKDTFRHFISGM